MSSRMYFKQYIYTYILERPPGSAVASNASRIEWTIENYINLHVKPEVENDSMASINKVVVFFPLNNGE